MLFSLPHHPKSWTRESKKGRNRSKRTCMGLSCLSRTLIREVSQTSVRLLMDLPSLTTTIVTKMEHLLMFQRYLYHESSLSGLDNTTYLVASARVLIVR